MKVPFSCTFWFLFLKLFWCKLIVQKIQTLHRMWMICLQIWSFGQKLSLVSCWDVTSFFIFFLLFSLYFSQTIQELIAAIIWGVFHFRYIPVVNESNIDRRYISLQKLCQIIARNPHKKTQPLVSFWVE